MAGRASKAVRFRSAETVLSSVDEDLLTVADVCGILGISRSTFYDWRQKRKGPRCITLPNGCLRVRRGELSEWLAGREDAGR